VQKVCIQGLGFVGAAMASAVAEARDAVGAPQFEVVGVDLPTSEGVARIQAINSGNFPFTTTDSALMTAVRRGRDTGNLRACSNPAEYENSDIIVVDVHLDVDFKAQPPAAKFEGFRAAIRTLAARVGEGTLVLVETTVPPGTTAHVVVPELRHGLRTRGLNPDSVLIAHSYERVMPGKEYLASIVNFWRVYAGDTEEAADACQAFLERVIDTNRYPLTRLKCTADSEAAKLMENSFRAVNIAFVDEWARFAEQAGIDLASVIQAIKIRPTHQNIMRPGFGVGGYCLTKDPLLAGVGARSFFGLTDVTFPFCEAAIETNHLMPRGTITSLRRALGDLAGKRLLLLGATYREDVADTRDSPSSDFVIWAQDEGASVDVHDPLVDKLEQFDRPVMRALPALDPYDAVVLAVAHEEYRKLAPRFWLRDARPLIFDANSVLTPHQIREFQAAGCRVKAVGRGHL
jgi:UDP-N-acetyl-D-glucosamine dehydrogenase